MLKRKPEDNLKEHIEIQKVKYIIASCNLHSDCPGEKQGAKIWKLYSLVSLHNTTCFVLADIKKSFRINTVKEVIVHPVGISSYSKWFHCLSHNAVTRDVDHDVSTALTAGGLEEIIHRGLHPNNIDRNNGIKIPEARIPMIKKHNGRLV